MLLVCQGRKSHNSKRNNNMYNDDNDIKYSEQEVVSQMVVFIKENEKSKSSVERNIICYNKTRK